MSVQDSMPSVPLVLPVALTIRHSRDIAEMLRAAFERAGDILVEVPAAADTDLSFIQLLQASRRHADTLGRSFYLSGPAEGSLLSTLARGGFLTNMTPQDSRFWLHGKEQMQ